MHLAASVRIACLASMAGLMAGGPAAAVTFAPVCGEAAGLYRGDNHREGRLLRAGVASRPKPDGRIVHLFEIVFDDGDSYILHGPRPERLRIAHADEPWSARLGTPDWHPDAPLPGVFQIVSDDGSPGPVFTFEGCEAEPAQRMAGAGR
jgi:hypothetical protein